MSYVTRKRAKFTTMTGASVNIPIHTRVEEVEEPNVGIILYHNNTPLCARDSQTAREFFAYDGDGQGLMRGKLLEAITSTLEKRDENHQARWDKLWGNTQANTLRRKDYEDFWVWDESFYRAPVLILQCIAGLIGIQS